MLGNAASYGLTISIHALRGEGDRPSSRHQSRYSISIHALRGEGDKPRSASIVYHLFISIHALRGEGDAKYPFAISSSLRSL